MTMNWKRNSKKYIAGILTIALAVGAGQSYGSMEVSAQERTLPGIEKLVQDTVASSDGTFHILEIVPSKENATIGYLAGGEEPVSETSLFEKGLTFLSFINFSPSGICTRALVLCLYISQEPISL